MIDKEKFFSSILFGSGTKTAALALLICAGLLVSDLRGQAYAQSHGGPEPCRPLGAKRGCSAQGKPGQQTCDGGVWSVCVPNPAGPPPPVVGTVIPKYYILTVVYAPPGTNGGRSSSSVNYGSTSTIGSTVSATDSFKQGTNVQVTASGGVLGSGDEAGVSFGVSNNSSNTQSLDIKKSISEEINDVGPASDGVNHDHDLIYLWLGPKLQVKMTPSSVGHPALLTWSPQAGPSIITYLYVAWLRDPSQMPPGEAQLLKNYGLTSQDFAQILRADQLGNSLRRSPVALPTSPDPTRFQLFGTLPYEPPLTAADPVPTNKRTLTFTNTQSTGSIVQTEYTVGLTLQASGGFLGLFTLAIKDQSNWTWTSSQNHSSSTTETETATLTIGGPAFGYQGPTEISVYYDLIYNTFLFVEGTPASPISLQGTITASNGKPIAGSDVVVVANGFTYHTATNAKGQYRIYRALSGPVRIQARGVTKNLTQVPANRRLDIAVP